MAPCSFLSLKQMLLLGNRGARPHRARRGGTGHPRYLPSVFPALIAPAARGAGEEAGAAEAVRVPPAAPSLRRHAVLPGRGSSDAPPAQPASLLREELFIAAPTRSPMGGFSPRSRYRAGAMLNKGGGGGEGSSAGA